MQTETIDLTEEGSRSDRSQKEFKRSALDRSADSLIDVDGLPYIGQVHDFFGLDLFFQQCLLDLYGSLLATSFRLYAQVNLIVAPTIR